MEPTDRDTTFMGRALELARGGLGLAAPNPMVGSVVVAGDRIVGEGWHEGPGTPHAEVRALAAAGARARGATLYVTLEPCSHMGRTGPCAPVVADAGIARVVAAMQDPNPDVNGQGFRLLQERGVEVRTGVLEDEARRLCEGFVSLATRGVPFVTLKVAASLDGRTAARDGTSRWITGEAARRDAHGMRAGSDAVMVGAGTAVADTPALTVRLDGYRGRQPLRIVVDGSGRTPPEGPLFDRAAPTLVATSRRAPEAAAAGWRAAGADVVVAGEDRVDMVALMEHLGGRRLGAVLIEGGATLAWAAVEAGVVDRVVVYLAPKLVGGVDSPGVLDGRGFAPIGDARPVRIVSVERMGEDLKVVADVHRDR